MDEEQSMQPCIRKYAIAVQPESGPMELISLKLKMGDSLLKRKNRSATKA